ncbi:ArsR family transcriptional regulator [Natranaerovirga hydrolytica]|uniref:ArsR family transcriptional regulator n=1 Tax=Natranaerovirga hydrolytica TaxID=680378 RepID=A0A4R1MJE0_9FIRM|nr:metalloregulator ArsR/SmtB family transcription factor [Natranaerovirga hydrolytica]TCK92826.1 ArsR family transcriptional regulator [Natranaerovirga hydrolytica]
MEKNYEAYAKIFKVLSDPKRLKIVDILSCGERCACDILEEFDFTQPTLSHHMKVLMEYGLVKSRKDGLWCYYSLDVTNGNQMVLFLMGVITQTDDCVCKNNCNCK